jgi:hypothetical protein
MPKHVAGKFYQLLKTHAGQTGNLGDAGGDTDDRADFARRQLRREGFSNPWLIPANVRSKTLCKFSGAAFMRSLLRAWLLQVQVRGLALAFLRALVLLV